MKKFLFGSILIFIFLPFFPVSAETIVQRLNGYILLQTESKGEAWYVNPADSKRYYLKNGDDAYRALRKFGLGITDGNLNKIPVGVDQRVKDIDSDGDGLPDKLEEAIGTDPQKTDTDGDGYSDLAEVQSGYDPLSRLKLKFDQTLANHLKGKILLQVQTQGQAWYVNPRDGKRYYLKDGEAAYQIMRFLSLGITNKDLAQISTGTLADSELAAVGSSFDKIREAILTGNKDLLLRYTTKKNLDFLTNWTVAKKVGNLEFIKAIYQGGYYIVTYKTTYDNGRSDIADILFFKEDNIWKEGMAETFEWSASLYQKEKQAAIASAPADGKVDFIITDIKVYPQSPKINSEDAEVEVYVKNIGNKSAVDGVSLEVTLENSYMPPINTALMGEVVQPGETVTVDANLFSSLIETQIGQKDQPGTKNISVTIDDLNAPMDDITSNNSLIKSFTFVE